MTKEPQAKPKHVVVSGVQPSGQSHLGNYAGSYRQWLKLQKDPTFRCFFFIADLHSLTENYDGIAVCIFPEWTDGYGVLCDTPNQLYCEDPYVCETFTAHQIGTVCTRSCPTGECRLPSECGAPRIPAGPFCGMATWFGYGKECGSAIECQDHDKYTECPNGYCTTQCGEGCPPDTNCDGNYCEGFR